MFELHPRLAADTVTVGHLPLCQVLLMNDSQYPWLILVPCRNAIRESYELPEPERVLLWQEVESVAQALSGHAGADKMNIAALGNQVPQLHVHVIARFAGDPAWPGPVWGVRPVQPYESVHIDGLLGELRQLLKPLGLTVETDE